MKNPPSLKTRRQFLESAVIGGALTWTLPAFLSQTFNALGAEAQKGVTGKDSTILVAVQLAGGNDGLNTIVPYTNDHYLSARPTLALKGGEVLKVDDTFGFHPALSGLKALYDAGQMAVYHGVGYPNPNRSHFRSTEIWHTASDADKFERHGWLGRYFDNACQGADPTVGLALGRQMPQAFAAKRPGVALENPEQYRLGSMDLAAEDEMESSEPFLRRMSDPAMLTDEATQSGASITAVNGTISAPGSALDYLERTALDAQVSSDQILSIAQKAANKAQYPASQFANNLKLVARLIAGGLPTRVFYLSQGGYDTHTGQSGSHERLLRDFSAAMHAFIQDLKAQGNHERVLVMTFSEFGRRVKQNANGGTDHGAAAPMFLFGGKLKPGLHGKFPSLAPNDLHNGDPKFTVDFRSIYAGILQQWLRADSAPIVGASVKPVTIV